MLVPADLLVAELAPETGKRGHGATINVSTVAASKGLPMGTAYGSSKAALEQLTRMWAAEYSPSGVRVDVVVPGIIETESVQAPDAAFVTGAFLAVDGGSSAV